MDIFDDLAAEQDRLDRILSELDEAAWDVPSAAAGWTVKDTVLHLAQTQEAALVMVADPAGALVPPLSGATMDLLGETLLRCERPRLAPVVFERWRTACERAVPTLAAADPQRQLRWAALPVKPATVATIELAEHWTHGLDITGPLGIDFPDTGRLRHVAWLAHRTLPYALARVGTPPQEIRIELTAPGGTEVWTFGPPEAEASITGPAGTFCRVAAQRMTPDQSQLHVTGPHGAAILKALRTYAP